jgi:hypothetical protein
MSVMSDIESNAMKWNSYIQYHTTADLLYLMYNSMHIKQHKRQSLTWTVPSKLQHRALERINLSMVHPCLSEDCLARTAKALGIKVLTGAVLVDALEAESHTWEEVGFLVGVCMYMLTSGLCMWCMYLRMYVSMYECMYVCMYGMVCMCVCIRLFNAAGVAGVTYKPQTICLSVYLKAEDVPARWVVFVLGAIQEEGNTSTLLARLRSLRIWPLVGGNIARMDQGTIYEITDNGASGLCHAWVYVSCMGILLLGVAVLCLCTYILLYMCVHFRFCSVLFET